jgi:hypothetical protein
MPCASSKNGMNWKNRRKNEKEQRMPCGRGREVKGPLTPTIGSYNISILNSHLYRAGQTG